MENMSGSQISNEMFAWAWLIWLALTLIILGWAGTAIIAWQSVPKEKRTWMTSLALGLVCLGTIGGVLVVIDASKGTEQLKARSDKISELQGQLISKNNELSGLYKKLALGNEQLTTIYKSVAAKNEKIAELNEFIAGSVTGGDSFCYLMPDHIGPERVGFHLIHDGKFPLFDVSIRVTSSSLTGADLSSAFPQSNDTKMLWSDSPDAVRRREEEWEKVHDRIKEIERKSVLANVQIGTVTHDINAQPYMEILDLKLPPNSNEQELEVFIYARNASFNQTIKFTRIKGYWKVDTYVYKMLPDNKKQRVRGVESHRWDPQTNEKLF
jgi:hypothetical protein